MSHKSKASNTGLLAYGINTKPDPIEVSPQQGNPSLTSLVITVSNNTMNPIYCNKLVFSFPIGDLAQDLASTATGIRVSAEPSSKWDIAQTADGVFTATPKKPEDNLITTDGISFNIFNIQVNKQVGVFTFSVKELSSTDNITFTEKNNAYDLGKFPYGFYMNNFAASSPLVKNGEQVTLTWSGSDLAAYTMFFDKESVDVTNVRSYLSKKLKTTTTFALQARVQLEGQTVDTYLYVTVIVSEPDFTATTLNVLKESNLQGATKIGTSLQVTGDTSLNNTTVKNITANETLTVSGNTTTKNINASSITVTGDANLGNAIANYSLLVKGPSTLNNVAVKGLFNATGTFSALKNPTLLASGKNITAAYFTAKTDGFVVSYIHYPDNVSKMSNVLARVYSSGLWFRHLGGTTGTFGSAWVKTMVLNPSTICVPVAAGTTAGYEGHQVDDNQLDSEMYFYWFPLGAAAAGEETFEMLEDGKFDAPPDPEMPEPISNENDEERKLNAYNFINKLEAAFGNHVPVSEELKQELAAALIKL